MLWGNRNKKVTFKHKQIVFFKHKQKAGTSRRFCKYGRPRIHGFILEGENENRDNYDFVNDEYNVILSKKKRFKLRIFKKRKKYFTTLLSKTAQEVKYLLFMSRIIIFELMEISAHLRVTYAVSFDCYAIELNYLMMG